MFLRAMLVAIASLALCAAAPLNIDSDICQKSEAQHAVCAVCGNPTYFQVTCEGINQNSCKTRTADGEQGCVADGLCSWANMHGGRCNDINVAKCPGSSAGLQECLDYNTGMWKQPPSAACEAKKLTCEKCTDSGCTGGDTPAPGPTPPPPTPTPPTPPAGNCDTKPVALGCPCGHKWDCASGICAGIPPTCKAATTPQATEILTEIETASPYCIHHIDKTQKTKCIDSCGASKFKMKPIEGPWWQPEQCPQPYFNTADHTVVIQQCKDGVSNFKYCQDDYVNVTVTNRGHAGAVSLSAPVLALQGMFHVSCKNKATCLQLNIPGGEDDPFWKANSYKYNVTEHPECAPWGETCGSTYPQLESVVKNVQGYHGVNLVKYGKP